MAIHLSAGPSRPPVQRRKEPLLAASAAMTFLVTFAVLLIPHEALPDSASAAEVTGFFEDNYLVQQSQTVMHSLGAVALLVFVAQLATVVRRLEHGPEPWGRLTMAGGAAFAATVVVSMGFVSAAVHLTGRIDGSVQEMLYLMGWDFSFKVAYLIPLVTLPACHVLRREGAAPAAVTWTGLVLGAAALASTAGNLLQQTMFLQYPVFMLFLLWTLVTGLTLGLRGVGGVPRSEVSA